MHLLLLTVENKFRKEVIYSISNIADNLLSSLASI